MEMPNLEYGKHKKTAVFTYSGFKQLFSN